MRLHCWFCQKSVSTEVPQDTIVRAMITCPECIMKGAVIFPPEPEKEKEIDAQTRGQS